MQTACCYCGGGSVNTATDLSTELSGKHKMVGLCERCSHEFYRLMDLNLPGRRAGWLSGEHNANTVIYAEIHEIEKPLA